MGRGGVYQDEIVWPDEALSGVVARRFHTSTCKQLSWMIHSSPLQLWRWDGTRLYHNVLGLKGEE
jgi:hypothetical protein